jgi:hypothetical protein
MLDATNVPRVASMASFSSVGAGGEAQIVRGGGPLLQLSMRRIHDLVAFCAPYEFEDVIGEVTGADRVEAENPEAIDRVRRVYKLARLGTGSRRLARAVTPALPAPRLTREYELFFPVFNHPFELFALAAVPEWRARCRRAACFISELWAHQLPGYLLELLAEFDHVFIGVRHPAEEVARLVGRPCTYLPLAVDVLRFAPYPDLPARSIDVCNIGRRSPVTHAALLVLARERRIFYYYDTVRASGERGKQMTFHVGNAAEHRLLLASVLQRSKYYVANRARVNEPEMTEGKEEISGRYYEGAAAGAVLIGEPPRSEEFRKQFDWADAVIRLPFDSADVGAILEKLEDDPGRLARIRRENVRQAALRHDWVHRVRTVFETLGMQPTPAMRAREEQLRSLAARTERAQADPP